MLAKMRKSEYARDRNESIATWVNERPEVKARVEEVSRTCRRPANGAPLSLAGFEIEDLVGHVG